MALDLTDRLTQILDALDHARDVETLRRRVQTPLREAFAVLGVLD
jgi:hypothetical protein